MSSYLLYTLETSRADGVTPSDALAYVAPLRRRRDPDALVFGGNLVVRADGGYHDDAVEHACERLGIPRYASYSYQDTSDAGNARLFERDGGDWVEVRHVEAWHETMAAADAQEYRAARGDDVPPDPEYSPWEDEHPPAVLQREHDFDTLGNSAASVREDRAGVVTECPEPTVADHVTAEATYHAVWSFDASGEAMESAERRLSAAYEAASGYRGVTVDDVTVEHGRVAVTLTAPAMLAPQKAADLLRWPASDAYRDRWSAGSGVPTSRIDNLFDGAWSPAAALEAVRTSDASWGEHDTRFHVAWSLPSPADSATAEDRVFAAAERWGFGDPAVDVREDVLGVGVDVDIYHSPWLVAHWLRDALHGDGHPADPVGFDGRSVTVTTNSASLAAHLDARQH